MGRRKLEIKRIKDKISRRVAFSKRRTGLFKKARQLSVLCEVDVSVVVFSDRGKPYEFCTGGSPNRHPKSWFLTEQRTTQEGVSEDIVFSNPCTRFRTCKDLLQSVRRVDEEPSEVSVTDMVDLEEELGAALMHTRSRKTQLMMERISTFHEQERKLTEKNEELKQKQKQQVVETEHKDNGEVDDDGGGPDDMGTYHNYQTISYPLITLPLFKE